MHITDPRTQHSARRIHKRLRKDPYDIEALFGLACLLGGNGAEIGQKRKVLQRILYLEPQHQPARRMLFEMDRAAIGGKTSHLSLATILTGPLSQEFSEPPLVLRYSLVYRLLVYSFLVGGMIVSVASLGGGQGYLWIGIFLAFLLWHISLVVELGESSISVSRLFGLMYAELPWREIVEVQPGFQRLGIKLIRRGGKAIVIPAQVQGYPFILDILHQSRPDLFQGMGILKKIETHPQKSVVVSQVARFGE